MAWSAAERVNWRWTKSAYTLYDERGMRAVAMERSVSTSPGVLAAQSSEAAHGNTLRRRGIQGRAARRPAALLVQAANRLPTKVTIAKEGMNPSGRQHPYGARAGGLWERGGRSLRRWQRCRAGAEQAG